VKIFGGTLDTLERALDARLLRHNVLAGNLANANTPGFTPRDVDFAAAMRSAAAAGDAGAPPMPKPGLDLASAGHAVAGEPTRDIALTAAGAIAPSAPGLPGSPIVAAQGGGAGLDGNAVDADRALAAVAENAIQYNAAARAAGKKLAILRYVASDGAA
jgi:flagellar basal-body rod protein FlgB